jgi:hypothetical protein
MPTLKYHKIFTVTLILLIWRYAILAQPSITDLPVSPRKEKSSTKKIGIWAFLSTRYFDRLKIDPGFYFANKIKRYNLQPAKRPQSFN